MQTDPLLIESTKILGSPKPVRVELGDEELTTEGDTNSDELLVAIVKVYNHPRPTIYRTKGKRIECNNRPNLAVPFNNLTRNERHSPHLRLEFSK